MASNFKFETRDERIERMYKDNPGRPIELCTAVVDGIWENKRSAIKSLIPTRFQEASIEDFGYMKKVLVDAIQLIFDPPTSNNKVGVIFSGPAGTGKTHAAYAILKMILEKNPEMIASMSSYSDVMSQLKTEFSSGSYEEMGSMWDKLNNISGMYDGLLFIDDVSSQKITDFELDKLMGLLETRFNSYMPFILTTNVKPKDFKSVFGERIASRLIGYCEVVDFGTKEVKDVRIKKE